MMDWSNLQDVPARASEPGVRVNMTSRAAFLEDMDARMRDGRGYAVATLNLDHVVKLQRQPDFRAAYARHTHVTADGNPIVWLSRIAGWKVELLPGSELIAPLAALAAAHGVPVALMGTTESSLARAGAALEAAHPSLRVVARISPAMGFDPTGAEAQACIATLRQSGARLCFLALGAPKQEIFAIHALNQLPDVGFLSVGAGLDFLSGDQTRAPTWVRRIAAEWIWRLVQDPGRLAARYGACIGLLPRLMLSALRSRWRTARTWQA